MILLGKCGSGRLLSNVWLLQLNKNLDKLFEVNDDWKKKTTLANGTKWLVEISTLDHDKI